MEHESVTWLAKAADWAWTVVLAVGAAMIAALRKLSSHEARLKALDDHHIERTKKLSDIERKIDTNQHMLLGSLDKLREDIRTDYRMVLSKLLDKVPPA